MSVRRLTLSLLLLLTLAVTACSAQEPEEPSAGTDEDSDDVAVEDDEEDDGDVEQTLRVATPGDVYITRDRVMLGIWPDNPNVCETLVEMDHDFQVQPGLATDWELVDDNTFRFTLRDGVVFHDGTPLTAEAVQHSIERVVEIDHTLSTEIDEGSVEIVDEHTVDITPTEENLRLPEQLVHNFFAIVAPGTDPADEPVCTGPFQFEEYEPNEQLVVSRFDDYWGEPAELDEMVFRFLEDASARRLALESDDVDLIYDLPLQQAQDVADTDGFDVAVPPAGATYVIGLNRNGDGAILQDEDVRRALAMSIDRAAIADDLFNGFAEPAHTVMPEGLLGDFADDVEQPPEDPEAAEELLDEAGWEMGDDGVRERDGEPLSLVAAAQFDTNPEFLEFLQAQAGEVGIELDLQLASDAAAYSDRIDAGEFDLDINYWNQNDANPARIPSLFWYMPQDNTRVELTGPGEEFDAIIERSLAASTTEEAAEHAAEATSYLVGETASAIPVTTFPFAYGLRDDVAGFDPHPSVNDMQWIDVHRTP